MITKLSIANFKSVRQLDIDCKKVNLFIGEPNTGKSNILEALGLLSWSGRPAQSPLGDYVRFQAMQNLFYDQLLDREIAICLSGVPSAELYIRFENDHFALRLERYRRTQGTFAELAKRRVDAVVDLCSALGELEHAAFEVQADVGRFTNARREVLRVLMLRGLLLGPHVHRIAMRFYNAYSKIGELQGDPERKVTPELVAAKNELEKLLPEFKPAD